MARVPALGGRGEGWVVLQAAGLAFVLFGDGLELPSPSAAVRLLTSVFGWAVIAGGAILGGSAIVVLQRAREARSAGSSDGLAEGGPYRVLRHPMYAGQILIAVGIAFLRLSVVSLAAAAVYFVVLDLKRRVEERFLRTRIAGYAAYEQGRRALVPFVY